MFSTLDSCKVLQQEQSDLPVIDVWQGKIICSPRIVQQIFLCPSAVRSSVLLSVRVCWHSRAGGGRGGGTQEPISQHWARLVRPDWCEQSEEERRERRQNCQFDMDQDYGPSLLSPSDKIQTSDKNRINWIYNFLFVSKYSSICMTCNFSHL